MTPVRQVQDMIVHGLCPNFHGGNAIFLHYTQTIVIQGIGAGGNPDTTEKTSFHKHIGLFEKTSHLFKRKPGKSTAVKSDLRSSPAIESFRLDCAFEYPSHIRLGSGLCTMGGYFFLFAEDTPVWAALMGDEDGYN
ncbi:MAG: hypothetical protein DRH37_08155 [Deltaproteobacteria bacterium]|nr:MAG: hypothetical protein DRH37_08155 [Deltaproteobacteria bacterium]